MASREENDDLVRKAAAGDPVALNRLLLRCFDATLQRIARRMPMDLERHVAPDDILQESLADVFRGIKTLQIQTWPGFVSWLRTIVDNRIRMTARSIRAAKRGPGTYAVSQAESRSLIASIAASERSPRSWLACQEQLELVREAVEHLDTTHRNVLRMRFLEGLDYDKIGEALEKKGGAVRMVAFRALRHLRGAISDDIPKPSRGQM